MSFFKRKALAQIVRPLVVLAGIAIALLVSQSCSNKSTDVEQPKARTWNQMTIDHHAAWSPDGSRIIYMREKAGGGRDSSWQFGAFVRDVATGRDSCLWPGALYDGFSWSPDGKKIALIQAGQVYIHNLISDTRRQITSANLNNTVQWSPCDDNLIFFDLWNYNGLQIYDFAADSIIVLGLHEALHGDWMPDCSTLVLMDSCVYTECGIYGYNTYTDSLWFIANTPGYKRDLAVSPDGRTVIFGVENELWTVDVSGGTPQRLTTQGGSDPDWSPDGQWIIYTKVDWYNGYLWLMRPDGSEKHQITF